MFQIGYALRAFLRKGRPSADREGAAGWRRKRDGGLKNNRSLPVKYPLRLWESPTTVASRKGSQEGASRRRHLQIAGFLTTIYEEVVKTATIRSFDAPQCAPHLRTVRPALGSRFLNLVHLGFCGNEPSPKELRGVSLKLSLQMAGFLTTSHAGCGQNRRHSRSRARAHACQAKPHTFGPADLVSARSHAERACPSRQQTARLHAYQWWRFRLWPSSYPTTRAFRRIRSNIYFVRTPKCSRRIQANERGASTCADTPE